MTMVDPPWESPKTRREFVSTPTTSSGRPGGTYADRTTVSRLIILAVGINSVVILWHSATDKGAATPQQVFLPDGSSLKIPRNLRAFAGTIIAGTLALFVNEVNADLGLLMAVGLVFIAFADVKFYDAIGGALMTGTSPTNAPGQFGNPKQQGPPPLVPAPGYAQTSGGTVASPYHSRPI